MGRVGAVTLVLSAGAAIYNRWYADGSHTEPPAGSVRPTEIVPAIPPQLAPEGGLSIFDEPAISKDHFITILEKANSPLFREGTAGKLYDYFVSLGIDPAVAEAFFRQESNFGTNGVARFTKGFANIRHGDKDSYLDHLASLGTTYPQLRGKIQIIDFDEYVNGPKDTFRDYSSSPLPWLAGGMDFANEMVAYLTWDWGPSVDKAVPDHFAPVSDGNDPDGYVANLKKFRNEWIAEGR